MRVKATIPILAGALLCGAPTVVGCSNDEGPFEEAGESIDEATEEVRDEIDDATTQ